MIEVYRNGFKFFEGNVRTIKNTLNFGEVTIKKYLNSGLPYKSGRHEYRFVRAVKKENEYETVKRLLLLYGNTNVVKNPKEIIERLKSEGIYVKVEHYKKTSKKDALLGSSREDWILTKV